MRVVVAMSGGVDSAVAAACCVRAGHEVIGVSLRLAREAGGGGCCSLDDFHDARAVAEQLGFPHYVFDFRDVFERRVVTPFVADYLAGRTPNPCARCNQHVKFDLLWRRARELGAACLATGHYARIVTDPETGRLALATAADERKDQSYFLFGLDQAALARTVFPIGALTKTAVREEARALGLPVADKPESMEACFVAEAGAAAFVETRAPAGALRPGVVTDEQGRVLGRHDGVHRFTVGQRRGLGLSGGGPRRYVRAIDAASGTVTVAEGEALGAAGLITRGTAWSAGAPPPVGSPLAVRIRHRHRPVDARLASVTGDVAAVRFDGRGPLPTPGQAAVFYRNDLVVGGGWIAEAIG